MNKPLNEHEQKLTVSIDVFVPDHPDRSESPIFRHARKLLIEDNPNACCEVCGTTENLELHHAIIEWCDSNAVDWEKVRAEHPGFDWVNFDETKPEQFIDSVYNARQVLCKKHHTGRNHGIHYLPYPIWQMQKHKRDDFVFSPDEE